MEPGNKTVTKRQYDKAVLTCIGLLASVREMHYKVAQISYEVCWAEGRGNVPPKHVYSIEKFAKDINVPWETLKQWRNQYRRVTSKLKKPLEADRRIIRAIVADVKDNASPSEVQKRYQEEIKKLCHGPEARVLMDMVKRLRVWKSRICSEYQLGKLSKNDLTVIKDFCYEIYLAIDQHQKGVAFKSCRVRKASELQKVNQ